MNSCNSVKDPVKLLAIRKIGKNYPILVNPIKPEFTGLTFWPEEAEQLLEAHGKGHEIVIVVITPWNKKNDDH